jgi:hypothetical protein
LSKDPSRVLIVTKFLVLIAFVGKKILIEFADRR